MIDFPQFGSSRNFIKPGHWLWVNQRQDDDDHVSRVVFQSWTSSLAPRDKKNKTFQPTPTIPTFDRRTRLLVILEHWTHSILSIVQNIKSMHEIKCWPSRRIVLINFKVDLATATAGEIRGQVVVEVIQDYCLHR